MTILELKVVFYSGSFSFSFFLSTNCDLAEEFCFPKMEKVAAQLQMFLFL